MMSQLVAVLRKSYLLKRKAPKSTLFELLFPLVILLILIAMDISSSSATMMFNIVLFLAFTISLSKLIFVLVTEREQRVAEMMKILGLSPIMFYASWFIFYALFMALVCFTVVLPLAYGGILPNSSAATLFMFYFLFCTSSISFSMALSTLFDSAKVAQSVGFLFYYLVQQVQYVIQPHWSATARNALAFFFPPLAFSLGGRTAEALEARGEGMTFSTLGFEHNKFTIGACMGLMAGATVFYFLMYVYFDQVIPHAVGVRKHWLFFLRRGKASNHAAQAITYASGCADNRVVIHGMTKTYGSKVALSDLHLELSMGEVTVLLGRNGAGKTTLINALTGMTEPTSGTATVLGRSIADDIGGVRQSMGFCPQHDVLWPQLTVNEHFEIFGRIRGLPISVIRERSARLITTLGLEGKEKAPVRTLSGGMKRKLSVGMAFIGDSKFVILDEPTSGLDPLSRRHLWEVLGKLREERVLLLSTHYMDEAEVLGDRVVILADGLLKANGTVHELKREYDCGYELVFATHADLDEFSACVHGVVGVHASVEAAPGGGKIKVTLPMESAQFLETLMAALKAQFGPMTGVDITSKRLDEVFMRIAAEGGDDAIDSEEEECGKLAGAPVLAIVYAASAIGLLVAQITATVVKRFRMFVREPRASLVQHLFPIGVIGFGLWVKKANDSPHGTNIMMEDFLVVVFVTIAFSSIGSSIASAINREKVSNSKFLQYVSGLSPTAYWTGTLVADLVEYYVFPFASTLLFLVVLSVNLSLRPVAMLLSVFGPAIMVQTYLLTVLIPRAGLARLVSLLINTVVGMIIPIMFVLLSASKDHRDWLPTVTWIMRVFPSYNLGEGLVIIPMFEHFKDSLPAPTPEDPDPLSHAPPFMSVDTLTEAISIPMLCLVVSFPIYLIVTILLDNATYTHRLGLPKKKSTEIGSLPQMLEDESVIRERVKAETGGSEVVLRVVNASKQYVAKGPLSVNYVPLAVATNGEVLTILGENGAGKTTLIKMAVGEVLPSSGDVFVGRFNTKSNIKEFRHLIGYCPQFDALTDALTVKDHLCLYARIKGVAGGSVDYAVARMTRWLGLEEYQNVKSKALSGGYKRRLSLAISLMGEPSVVFLDEPSCGMDPVARRQVWKVIESASQRFSVVLTTHSMEEAESISTRIGIMSRGRMTCVGTIPELRSKFSNGIELFMQTKSVVVDRDFVASLRASKESFASLCQRHSEKRARRFAGSAMSMIGVKSSAVVHFAEWWAQESINDEIESAIKASLGRVVESFDASGRSVRVLAVPKDGGISLDFIGSIFALLERIKASGSVVDYSVTQNSLERVFRAIADKETENNPAVLPE